MAELWAVNLGRPQVAGFLWLRRGANCRAYVAAFAYIFVKGIVPICKMYFDDKKHLRNTQTKQLSLVLEIEREQQRRKESSLDLGS